MSDQEETSMATVEAPLVTPMDTTVLYLARRSELRLTKKPRYPIRNPVSGVVDGYTPGEYFGFRDGQLRIPKSGTVRLSDTLNGGEFEIDAEEAHAWMDAHRLNGNREEGFWRVDPAAPAISNDELQTLMEAALQLDVETLEGIIEQEQAGWGREQVLTQARNALERIAQIHEATAAAQAEAAEGDTVGSAPAKAKPGPKPKAGNG
jgi:hypothetical protein